MVQECKETGGAALLFAGWQETMIWSCLQGVMGKIYINSQEKPLSAMAVLGDFCFLAGKPDRAFVRAAAPDQNGKDEEKAKFVIMVPGSEGWAELIEECLASKAKKVTRYAFKKEPDVFDREKLQRIVSKLPAGYALKGMDEALFAYCKKTDWCRDWVAQYKDYDTYRQYGLGTVILKDGEPVSGASSYSGYLGGIEVEIDTREDYRRKGLASICGAKLILECLERGWYPSWDAQNKWSAALAEKLGYHFDHAYTAYEVTQDGGRSG